MNLDSKWSGTEFPSHGGNIITPRCFSVFILDSGNTDGLLTGGVGSYERFINVLIKKEVIHIKHFSK